MGLALWVDYPQSLPVGGGVESSGGAQRRDTGAATLVLRVAVAERGAQVEFLDPVDAFAAGVGRPGAHRVDDLGAPGVEGTGEGEQLGDVVVVGAPGQQGGPPLADHAGRGG